jgi:perosamine synthetase
VVSTAPFKFIAAMSSFIPVNEPDLTGNEKKYLLECVETGWISSEGPFVTKFEEQFAARVGRKHGIAICNGTAALVAAVRALKLSPGDEVIMPAFTIISCITAILESGLKPVLVDVEPRTWNMNPDQVAAKVTAKSRAIMVVHTYGLPVEMNRILGIAQRHNLRIIEDAAEMHGQTYYGKPCGSFGDISAFSFYANKHITTGEGGMIVTDDPALAERSRALRNLCFQPARRFVHEEMGWNFRLTNLQAALGVAQLERLDEFVLKKRRMGALYTELLSGARGLELPVPEIAAAKNIYWVYGLVLSEEIPFDAAEMMERLKKLGIGTRPFFWGMHEQPVFQRQGWFKDERYPVTERLARRGFYLPSGLALTEAQQRRAVEAVKKALAA